MMKRLLLVLGLFATTALMSCGGSNGPAAGKEHGPCYGNGTCDPGLSCASNTCVVIGGSAGSGGTSGGAGTSGSAGTNGPAGTSGSAGASGGAGATGTAGAGGGGGQATCGSQAISGQVVFTGVSSIAFDRSTTTVTHKRDIDAFEDGCLNQLTFVVGFAAGCNMEIRAGQCVDDQGRMKVTRVDFSADSQCPSFPDAIEGTYRDTGANIADSWVSMSAPRIADRNVAASCVQERFEITLVGRLAQSGGNTLTFGGGSTLVVNGAFQSNALDQSCPATCPGSTGAGGRGGAGGTAGASGAGGGTGGTAGASGAGGTSGGTGGTAGRGGSGAQGGTGGRGGAAGTGGRGGAGGSGGCTTDSQCAADLHCYVGACIGKSTYGPCVASSAPRHCPTSAATCLGGPPTSGNTFGFCSLSCDSAAPCPAPASGTATARCAGNICVLDCAGGRTCPTGMLCSADLCYWPI